MKEGQYINWGQERWFHHRCVAVGLIGNRRDILGRISIGGTTGIRILDKYAQFY